EPDALDRLRRGALHVVERPARVRRPGRGQHDEPLRAGGGRRVEDGDPPVDRLRARLRGAERRAHRGRDREHEHAVVGHAAPNRLRELARRRARRRDLVVAEDLLDRQLVGVDVTLAEVEPHRDDRDAVLVDELGRQRRRAVGHDRDGTHAEGSLRPACPPPPGRGGSTGALAARYPPATGSPAHGCVVPPAPPRGDDAGGGCVVGSALDSGPSWSNSSRRPYVRASRCSGGRLPASRWAYIGTASARPVHTPWTPYRPPSNGVSAAIARNTIRPVLRNVVPTISATSSSTAPGHPRTQSAPSDGAKPRPPAPRR